MPGLLVSLFNTAEALRVFERALEVTENNVANASTPGFARQRLSLAARPFEPELGLPGGLEAGPLESARDTYAEQQVRRALHDFSRSSETAAQLARIEPLFDITGESGLPGALSALFQSFTAWSMTPNDTVARRLVLERAGELSDRFAETTSALRGASAASDSAVRHSLDTVNALARRLRDLNAEFRRDRRNAADPGLDARLHNTLEELAEYVEFTLIRAEDGSVTVLLGGQTALVTAEREFELSAEFTAGAAIVRDAQGRAITAQIGQGRLGALLDFRNSVTPSLLADLNRLASALADRINTVLAAGVDANGQPGAPLFVYDPAEPASTLRVTGLAPEDLAGALSAAPGGNGNALALAALTDSPEIDGFSFLGFYATIARRTGRVLESAREERDTREQVLLQARSLRAQSSGVSLDEEAVRLIEFQRSYEATARVAGTLQELIETLIGMIR